MDLWCESRASFSLLRALDGRCIPAHLPLLILLVPKELIATADGEPNRSVEAETLTENAVGKRA
jgi:hypothetical protein